MHMWHLDERKTSRVQVFRGEKGNGLALITLRDGDFAASHVNNAVRYRRLIWEEFFPKDAAPPTLIANLLHPELWLEDKPSVVEIEFDDCPPDDFRTCRVHLRTRVAHTYHFAMFSSLSTKKQGKNDLHNDTPEE